MNFVRCGHTFSNRGLLGPSRCAAPHYSAKKTIPTDEDTSKKKLMVRSIQAKGRGTKDWTAIAWPTNIQSRTPDGQFGPAKKMKEWGDCWFMAPLAAVANDEDGHKILAESIKKVDGGFDVTFKGSPNNSVFISDSEFDNFIDENGGDADSRLMELAADKFFNKNGNFKSTYIAALTAGGWSQARVERCLQNLQESGLFQDAMTHNPMRGGAPSVVAFFMFTGIYPDELFAASGTTMKEDDVMSFLNTYITNDRDGASVTINGINNPLGNHSDLLTLLLQWDVIRTEITSNGTLSSQQLAFLNALDRWIETRTPNDMNVLRSSARELWLQHPDTDPETFVDLLDRNQLNMSQKHVNLLRSGVQQVLEGKSGYIGFCGHHTGTIEGINRAMNAFTYCEPNNPTLVHTGVLSDLIHAIASRNIFLTALKPTTERDERGLFENAGTSTGRQLRQIHDQVVSDGKIDQAESGPLANLMAMDDDTFRQVYDSDKNGVIEGDELKAVQMRVDRWVEHFELTPLW